MCHRAAGLALGRTMNVSVACRPRRHGAGRERNQREDFPAQRTHRAKLTSNC
jgi:hypothetical protein